MSRRTIAWMLAALLGIALTAAITWGTSQLTSQRIGISSEPISAGEGLAPRRVERRHVTRQAKPTRTKTEATPSTPIGTTPVPVAPPSETAAPEAPVEAETKVPAQGGESSRDDSGGKSSGHGRDD